MKVERPCSNGPACNWLDCDSDWHEERELLKVQACPLCGAKECDFWPDGLARCDECGLGVTASTCWCGHAEDRHSPEALCSARKMSLWDRYRATCADCPQHEKRGWGS